MSIGGRRVGCSALTHSSLGTIRQQPQNSVAKGWRRRALHLHRARGRRPQDLLHSILRQWQDRLAQHFEPQRRHQIDPRHDHWRVERDRELGQRQAAGHPVKDQGPQLTTAGHSKGTGLPKGMVITACLRLSKTKPRRLTSITGTRS